MTLFGRLTRLLPLAANPLAMAALALTSLLALTSCGGAADADSRSVPQTLSFAQPADLTYGTLPATLAAASTSGLAVTFATATPAVCSVSGNVVTIVTTGNCTLVASQEGNAVYAAAPPQTKSFAVRPAPQTLTFISPGNQIFGAAPAALVATSTSGLAVSFASTTPNVCAVTGTTVVLLAVGDCTVEARQPGNTLYAAATPVARSFAVAAALLAQTITFASPGNQTLGTAPPVLAASASSGLPVSLSSLTPAVCTVAGTTLTLASAGNCTLAASQAGNATYAAATTVMNTFAVAARSQIITFASPGTQGLASPTLALVASASSGLSVGFASTTPNVCTVSGSTLALLAVGNCTVNASQAGDATYTAAPLVSNTFAVTLSAQTISFAAPGNQTLGTAPAALVASASSGLPVTLASTTSAVCTVSGSTLTLVAAGTCTLSASQAGNAAFAAATAVINSFAVAKAAQTITFNSPGSQTLGVAPPALVASSSSGLSVTLASTTPSTCSVNGTTLTLIAAGTCIVDASQAGNNTYAAAVTVSRVITIAAAPLTAQTISFTAPATSQTLGTAPGALVATASSGLVVSFASTTPSTCSVNGSTLALIAAGTCMVDASQAGNGTYAAAPTVTRVFTIVQAAQTISFVSPGAQIVGATVALSASSSSLLVVSFTSTTPGVCTVSGSTLSLVAAGTCSIDANQAGNTIYAAATTVTRAFSVSAAPLTPQTITFNSPGNQTLGTAAPALVATASSGLVVSFASATAGVCTVSGNTLTLVSIGTCTIDASQAGDATYSSAPTVTRSFAVAGAPQTISFTGPALNQTLGFAPGPLVAAASSGLVVSFASATPLTCSVSGNTLTLLSAGNCSVDASQAGSSFYAAAPTVTRVFTISQASQTITFSSPGSQVLGTSPALIASASSGLPVSFSSTTLAVCTVSGNTLTLLSAGNCTIVASQAGNASFSAAAPVSNTFAVTQAAQTISFNSPGRQVLDKPTPFAAPAALVATATSGLTVSFASTTPAICSASGTALTLLGSVAGTCTIVASQAGDATYAAAAPVTQSFAVAVELFANGGFAAAPNDWSTPATAWLAAASGYTRSSDSHSGGFSAQLASPALNAAVLLQNSADQGGRPALVPGTTPVLTFWAKGFAGTTGNVLFALRYLDGIGNIKATSGNQFFQAQINPNTWTKITYTLPGGVPAGAVAAFIEFSQAIGPIDISNLAGAVLIDDVSLQVP